MLKIYDIKIENLKNPIGIDETKPIFKWKLESSNKNVFQKTYRIIVKNNKEVVWDTLDVKSEEQVGIEYEGKDLVKFTRYDVEITVKDNFNEEAKEVSFFEMGFIKNENITAKFITSDDETEGCCHKFVKEFNISKKVNKARAYVTSFGMYDLNVNGKKALDIYYTPYWTSYSHRLEYQTYDITSLIKEHNNIEIYVSDGWYRGELTWLKKTNFYGDKLGLLAEIHIYYNDGSVEVIKTDESWKYSECYIRYTSIYHGETQDYNYSNKELKNSKYLNKKEPVIISQINEYVKNIDTLEPVNITRKDNNRFIIDFGQNITGVAEISLKRDKGTTIRLRHSEVLIDGELYIDNLRNAKCTDTYILDENYRVCSPLFTWHGFRFMEISGLESLDDVIIKAYSRHTDMERTGYFNTTNRDVNRLYLNQLWSNKDNYLDIPTDCPQRDERLGWTADVSDYCETAAKNFDVLCTLSKWLGDVKLEQTMEYGVPHIVPNPLEKEDAAASAWSDAATIVPIKLYNVYRDKRILKRQYDSMKDWVEFIRNHSEKSGLWMTYFQFGDWLALDKDAFSDRTGATDLYYITNVFYLYSIRNTKEAARVLKYKNEYLKYSILERKVLKAIQKEYITKTGRIVSDTQTGMVLALQFNLFKKKKHIEYAKERLKNNILKFGHLMTGFLGTPFIMNILTDLNMNDLCDMLLLREEFPGWLYEIKRDATTMWERWDGMDENGKYHGHDMNSFNHCAYGSIAEWMYRKVGGIDYLEPGYKKILIKPNRIKTLDKTECSINSIYGKIIVNTDYILKKMDCTIPVNTRAIVYLPNGEIKEISSGSYSFNF